MIFLLLDRRWDAPHLRRVAKFGVCWLAIACGDGEPPPSEEQGFREAFDASDIWLLNAWGPDSGDEVYAVGGTEDEGRVMHYDGDEWQRVDLGLDVPLLTWAHGFGGDDVVIVGNEGTVIHYDGSDWSLQPTPTAQNLWGVWGERPDDLWAVGGRGLDEGDATLLHYDGDEWSDVEVPDLERAGVYAFFKVWGTSSDNVYVVGQNGAVLHYDGEQWEEQLVGASGDLISLWGTGPDNIIAVGGRGTGIVSVFDGAEWRTETLPRYSGLNGVWLKDEKRAYLVGVLGAILEFDPSDFSAVDESYDTRLDLHGVFGTKNDELFAVGGNFNNTVPPYVGIALVREL